jgi:hypothetical protein
MYMRKVSVVLTFTILMILTAMAQADEMLKPFILASEGTGDVNTTAADVKAKLTAAGFEIAGEYSPYQNADIIVVTSDALKKAAAKSEFGGYGAGQRVSITKVKDQIQVAYTNPVYMANAYRMKADLKDVAAQLKKALGYVKAFGSKEGLEADDLRDYHYMFGMEYFTDPSELAKYPSYDKAVAAVESGLAAGKGGTGKVYRIDIPGKDESVFGVSLTKDCSSDKFVMGNIDFKPIRSTAHLPYEMLVSGNEVYALYARFRIAIDFPDLKMMGDNSFFKIMCAPDDIEKALKAAAGEGVKKKKEEFHIF